MVVSTIKVSLQIILTPRVQLLQFLCLISRQLRHRVQNRQRNRSQNGDRMNLGVQKAICVRRVINGSLVRVI